MPLNLFVQSGRHIAVNIVLALIPVALAFSAAYTGRKFTSANSKFRWLVFFPLFVAWIAFLPNTCYLWTEWRHYLHTVGLVSGVQNGRHDHGTIVGLLFITGFYVLYTGLGVVTFFLSIWPLERLMRQHSVPASWLLQAVLFQLCSLGVYLGLIDRFNTKDLLRPWYVDRVWNSSLSALSNPLDITLIVLFGLVLWSVYIFCDIWLDGAVLRIKRFRTSISLNLTQ